MSVTVVWREYFDDAAVKRLTEMGTLPRYESEIADEQFDSGEDVAAELARECNREDSTQFASGGDIVILEPECYAGRYNVLVDYEPSFSAYTVK